MWWNRLFRLNSTPVGQFVFRTMQLIYPEPATHTDYPLRIDTSCSETAEHAAHMRLNSTNEWNIAMPDHKSVPVYLNPIMAGATPALTCKTLPSLRLCRSCNLHGFPNHHRSC